jgi:uroporphyrin-III C-methyltransferase/precorrin-2 dehydrogenase/sirohydrochlorin ferrochelatase
MPIALIQQGTTHFQRVFTGTLESILEIVKQDPPTPPTLIIVGEVVTLRDKLAWFIPPQHPEQGATSPIMAQG